MRKTYTALPLDEPDPGLREPSTVWMPILMVRFYANHKATPFLIQAVVDSGSPYCLARADIAQFLGLRVESGTQHKLGGIIVGTQEPIYFHKCKIHVESVGILKPRLAL